VPGLNAVTENRATGAERATLARSFAELLSSETPMQQVWPRAARLLARMMDANDALVVMHERDGKGKAADRFASGMPAAAPDDGESLLAEVLAINQIVFRPAAGGVDIGVPIRFGRTLHGAIVIFGAAASDEGAVALLESCALYAGARISNDGVRSARTRYERLASTDALTGLANRRRFDEVLEAEWKRAERMHAPLALIMLDIDYFKAFNDTYGHPAGDHCLRQVARTLSDALKRPADIIARYGGEEFVALLPSTDLNGGFALAEALRESIAGLHIGHAASSLGRLTVSLGVATTVPARGETSDRLVTTADAALYEAKRGGRNRVCAQNDAPASTLLPVRLQRAAIPNNIPLQTTALIGRRAEVRDALGLLRDNLLVTITGSGGAGKTRVALSVAAEALAAFADGVCFIDLARLADARLIGSTIGSFLGVQIAADDRADESLLEALRDKQMLFVFDNCDYLVQPVAELCAALLQTCGGVRILATSREPLGIAAEARYRLPLLDVPPAGPALTGAGALTYSAVALFVARATAANHRFAITDANAAVIADICRRLDGIALAIELAAARSGTLDLHDLAQRLDERFRLLRGGDRSASPRQQTLHALIAWSYDLLSEQERTVFLRLSIFAGSWSSAAAGEICTGDGISRDDLLDIIDALVRKSLIVDEVTGADNRFRLLGSIRAFAHEKFAATPADATLARRHAAYFLTIAQNAERTLRTTSSRDWLEAHEHNLDDYRAVFDWSLTARADPEVGARLACALQYMFLARAVGEGKRWLDNAIGQIVPGSAPGLEGALCLGLASLMRNQSPSIGRDAAERAIAHFRRSGDLPELAEALRLYAQLIGWYFPEQLADGRERAAEALAIARRIDDPIAIALALRAGAVTLHPEALGQRRTLFEESLQLSRAHGNDTQINTALTTLAELEFRAGCTNQALVYGRDAIRYGEASGRDDLLAFAHINQAVYAAAAGDAVTARRSATAGLQIAVQRRFAEYLSWSIQALAAVSIADGDFTRAARAIGFCDARAGIVHAPRKAHSSIAISYALLTDKIRAFIGEAAFARETAAGAILEESAAVGAALIVRTPPAQRA
jgi:diguanylate cyclase (GGDEF)-like protein